MFVSIYVDTVDGKATVLMDRPTFRENTNTDFVKGKVTKIN